MTDTVQISELGAEIFTDDFDRANGALGGSWIVDHQNGAIDWRVNSNTADYNGTDLAYAVWPSGRPVGVDVRVTVLADGTDRWLGLALDLEETGDESFIAWQALILISPGATEFISSSGTDVEGPAVVSGDRLRLTDDGVTVTAYVNGVVIGTADHDPLRESGNHGFIAYQSSGPPVDLFTDHSDEPYTDHADDPYLPH